jgi:hypothetical protein
MYKPEMVHFTAQMNFVTYNTGKWLNPFADKSGAYVFLPDGPSKVGEHFITLVLFGIARFYNYHISVCFKLFYTV